MSAGPASPPAGRQRPRTSAGRPPIVVIGRSLVLNLLRCVRPTGARVLLVTFGADPFVYRSRLFDEVHDVPAPGQAPDAFAARLAEIGAAAGGMRPVLYYGDDASLLAVSRHRDRLQEHFRFVMPPPEVIETAIHKDRFARLAREFELPVPSTCTLSPETGYDPGACALRFPVIAKPLSRVGWFRTDLSKRFGKHGKAMLIENAATLAEVAAIARDAQIGVVVQELVEGTEASVVSYHSYMSSSGTVLGEFTGRKLRTCPIEFGLSSSVEVTDLPDVRHLGRSLVERMKLIGPCKLDLKRCSRTGKLFLLEINARYNLWHYPAKEAGVNLPLIAYCDQTDLDPPRPATRLQDTLWVQGGLDRTAVVQEGGSYWRVWLGRLGRRTVYDVWWWRDPLPMAHLFAEKIARRVRKVLAIG